VWIMKGETVMLGGVVGQALGHDFDLGRNFQYAVTGMH
jgi:hypothetical protein